VAGDTGYNAVDLASLKATKLTEGGYILYAVWMGKRVAYVGMGGVGLSPIQFYDPASKRAEELETAGMPLAGSPSGETLLAIVNPKSSKEFSLDDYKNNASMVCLDPKGKITKELVSVHFQNPLVVSPSFKFLAFHNKKDKTDSASPISVVDLDTKVVETVDDPGRPIGATDSGRLLTLADKPEADGSPIMLWRDGKSVVLVAKAQAATFNGKDVYYVTGGGTEAVLRSVPLPPEPSTGRSEKANRTAN
jgi:hypothetical protein